MSNDFGKCRSKQLGDLLAQPEWQRQQNSRQQVLERMPGKGTLVLCWWDRNPVQPLWKSKRRIPEKLKVSQQHDPATPPLGMHSKDLTSYSVDACSAMCVATVFVDSQARGTS